MGQQRTRKGPAARDTMAGMAACSTWNQVFVLMELWPPAPENLCSLGPAPVGTSGPGLPGHAGQVLAPRLDPLYKCREGQSGLCLPGPSPLTPPQIKNLSQNYSDHLCRYQQRVLPKLYSKGRSPVHPSRPLPQHTGLGAHKHPGKEPSMSVARSARVKPRSQAADWAGLQRVQRHHSVGSVGLREEDMLTGPLEAHFCWGVLRSPHCSARRARACGCSGSATRSKLVCSLQSTSRTSAGSTFPVNLRTGSSLQREGVHGGLLSRHWQRALKFHRPDNRSLTCPSVSKSLPGRALGLLSHPGSGSDACFPACPAGSPGMWASTHATLRKGL